MLARTLGVIHRETRREASTPVRRLASTRFVAWARSELSTGASLAGLLWHIWPEESCFRGGER